jgi:hypothetical protein
MSCRDHAEGVPLWPEFMGLLPKMRVFLEGTN